MTPTGLALIQQFEKLRLEAYLDSGDVPTIGWGTTHYPGGRPVQMGDTCTADQANGWLARDVTMAEADVATMFSGLTPNQSDALISFAYNLGADALRVSSLRRTIQANPLDPTIRDHFMPWHFEGHTPLLGLWRRRHAEADRYFDVATLCPEMPEPPPQLNAA